MASSFQLVFVFNVIDVKKARRAVPFYYAILTIFIETLVLPAAKETVPLTDATMRSCCPVATVRKTIPSDDCPSANRWVEPGTVAAGSVTRRTVSPAVTPEAGVTW